MLLTDAANEVINLDKLTDVAANVHGNKLSISDEFGTMTRLFTDNDPEIVSKVRRLWGDFLQRRTTKLRERMEANDTTERWYEVHIDEPFAGSKRCDTMEQVLEEVKRCEENKYNGVKVFYLTRAEIDPTEEVD